MPAWKFSGCVALCALFAIGCNDQDEDPRQAGALASYDSVQSDQADRPLALRMRGAERVVVATVEQVEPELGLNEFGDKLIMSTVTLRVQESLRGEASSAVRFQLEGGTVGELTLDVSDLPKLAQGDRGVFSLRRSRSGDGWVPHRRSLGILLMDIDGDLDAVRQAERESR